MSLEIPPIVLDHAPWSPSMASTAINCPQAFAFRYKKKQKRVEPESLDSKVGTAVHGILEWVAQGVAVDKAFAQAIEAYPLPHEGQMLIQTYRDAVADFKKGLEEFDRKFGIHELMTEKKIALTPDFTLTKFFDKGGLVRGVIDLVVITKTKKVVIIDHKSGAVKPIDLYQTQTEAYAVFIERLVNGLEGVRIAIHYVGADPNINGKRTVWAPEYNMEVVRTQFRENLIAYLLKAAEAVADSEEPHKCWLCNYCGYKPICPAYQ
jgi:RecB family exonuclease